METARTGEWVEEARGLDEYQQQGFPTQIPNSEYTSHEFQQLEREHIWNKVWQFAGRESEVPGPGDWKEYKILDQTYIIVRGKDGTIRGFVNACRHRGNVLCQGSGTAKRGFLCQYHLWSYDLEGKLLGMLREKAQGDLDKDDLSLIPVPVDTFGGFIFLNPDPDAQPLSVYLGEDVNRLLAPYRLEEMTTVMNVRENIPCNWKVVMDAFEEGYHISGIHPELLNVIALDPTTSKFQFFDNHSVACAPFDVANSLSPEDEILGIKALPETFPGTAAVMPRFDELVSEYQTDDGRVAFPDGVTGRTILQQATRDTLTGMGLDVSGLTDAQMSDNHGWVLFPNLFMTIRAGEAHIVMAVPDPDGDPNRCIWHVASFMWLPEELRDVYKADLVEVDEPGSYKYFLALQQDYEQMPRQQRGLRNTGLKYMSLVKEEIVVSHFHHVLNKHIAGL
ncbi:UNVERIFIED_CONTAM: Rieske-like 2Fe-2S protein [Williamsia faeni]